MAICHCMCKVASSTPLRNQVTGYSYTKLHLILSDVGIFKLFKGLKKLLENEVKFKD